MTPPRFRSDHRCVGVGILLVGCLLVAAQEAPTFILDGIATPPTADDQAVALFRSEVHRLTGPRSREDDGSAHQLRNGYCFFKEELDCLLAHPVNAPAELAGSISGYRDHLQKQGIDLLYIFLPTKWEIYPDQVTAKVSAPASGVFPSLDRFRAELFAELAKKGVRYLDLTPVFMANRNHAIGPTHFREDTHISPVGCVLTAQAIAREVKKQGWYTEAAKTTGTTATWKDGIVSINGDCGGTGKEIISARIIAGYPDAAPSAPVVIIGDSNCEPCIGPMGKQKIQCGLPLQLMYELQLPLDWFCAAGGSQGGSQQEFEIKGAKSRSYRSAKKLALWITSGRLNRDKIGGLPPANGGE